MRTHHFTISSLAVALLFFAPTVRAQLVDNNLAPNTAKAGINKSLANEIGPGRGDLMTPNSSLFIINRDPFRSVRRGRQIFQRKFSAHRAKVPTTVMAPATSTSRGESAQDFLIAAPAATDVRAVPQAQVVMWLPGQTAVTLHTYLGWD